MDDYEMVGFCMVSCIFLKDVLKKSKVLKVRQKQQTSLHHANTDFMRLFFNLMSVINSYNEENKGHCRLYIK